MVQEEKHIIEQKFTFVEDKLSEAEERNNYYE